MSRSARFFAKPLFSALTALVLLAGCSDKEDAAATADTPVPAVEVDNTEEQSGPSILDVEAIAEEAFIYGLPIVMNYAVMNEFVIDRNSGQWKAPFNTLHNDSRVLTDQDTAVVTPNSDTPYSMVWLDLRAEPMVISVPAVPEERYYSVQMVDGNVYNFGYIGTRATGSEAGSYMIAGPGWDGETPAGIERVFNATTPFALSLFRTQLFNAADMPNVAAIQAGYKAEPLSSFLDQAPPAAAPEIDFLPASTAGIKRNFYDYLNAALELIPLTPANREIREKLLRIGIGPGRTFDLNELSAKHKAAALLAIPTAQYRINEYLDAGMYSVNGWNIGALFGDQAFYDNDWVKRAAAAQGGIYGNDSAEAVYPMTRNDVDGDVLDGSKNSYTLTFPAGELPPVNAFWSVTMYDGKSQLLIENPINRYLINSTMWSDMTKNEDGSLTIYIQKDSPGANLEANWLPAPADTMYLVMRLYWPKTEAPSVLPIGEGAWSPPGIRKTP